MALTKEKKGAIVEKMTSILRGAKATVFVSFGGVSVAEVAAMRRSLRARGVGYTVVKKTLVRRALDAENLAGERPEFPGEFAIAYGDDDVEPAKGVAEFAKKFDGRVSPVGGILESRYISKDEVVALSLVPSRQVLYGMFANLMNSPMQGTVTVLSGVMRAFAVALNQIAEKKA
ncbi:MAG: 50S ribosomal protein L10 [Candidatus Lloydbacteria bacterium RIFCSPHIGHO2_02_FULL_51_22]|uniref:Large ribosomal subunit protein uL10 n=3 Tax=Candidatus Lloydiibacteriota TaxID=1817910 RepID=A0A1G2DAY5_9BACT|nr:MAG: 50S ribosomal protein L10 [Candidatus Lloydbacteria bacterium RIFCSPHIGHO2_02_FULL_51_22]OGZ13996.1 MAG: 50S ribosomal protein L10 [Candidatus Lloydbacteria bacterium RIFCSPLOWO2_02_FULL_51_11]OGZ16713.1 MAG: 50S ribosomal protein L10 [Candidatus Lloydbacteria bacterium RIFCSPLOWO2_12_FULL_51_9]